jgi:hypothetical protein
MTVSRLGERRGDGWNFVSISAVCELRDQQWACGSVSAPAQASPGPSTLDVWAATLQGFARGWQNSTPSRVQNPFDPRDGYGVRLSCTTFGRTTTCY